MKYEFFVEFNKQFEEYIEVEQKAMKEVTNFFSNEIIPFLPKHTNLKLYELSHWITENFETLSEIIKIPYSYFNNFCNDLYDGGNELLNEREMRRSYFGSSSSFVYITKNLNENVLRSLKDKQIDWTYIEYQIINGMTHEMYDVNMIKENTEKVREIMYDVILNYCDTECTAYEIQCAFEEYNFWHDFKHNLEQDQLKEEFLSLVKTYKELEDFKKNAIVEFLYYIQYDLETEYNNTSNEEEIKKLENHIEIVKEFIEKEKNKLGKNV